MIAKTSDMVFHHPCDEPAKCAQRSLVFFTLLSLVCSSTVSGQPLHLPAERFKCGPHELNMTCERWGYEACISDNDEFYCFPCYDDYLKTLCGTKDEMEGCNLYCTQKAMDKEKGKLTADFTERLAYLLEQTNLYKKKANMQEKRTKTVEEHLRNKTITLQANMTVLGIVFLLILIFFIRRCIRRKHCKRNHDIENLEQEPSISTPLTKDEISVGVSEVSEDTKLKELNITPDSLEELKVSDSDEKCTTTPDMEQIIAGQQNDCPAVVKLGNVPATNRKGNNKFAIKTCDINHPQTSI